MVKSVCCRMFVAFIQMEWICCSLNECFKIEISLCSCAWAYVSSVWGPHHEAIEFYPFEYTNTTEQIGSLWSDQFVFVPNGIGMIFNYFEPNKRHQNPFPLLLHVCMCVCVCLFPMLFKQKNLANNIKWALIVRSSIDIQYINVKYYCSLDQYS